MNHYYVTETLFLTFVSWKVNICQLNDTCNLAMFILYFMWSSSHAAVVMCLHYVYQLNG